MDRNGKNWGLLCPPNSELAMFVTMLDRGKVRYNYLKDPDGSVEIDLSPADPDGLACEAGTHPQLTGDPWGSSNFRFLATGELERVDIQGD